MGSGFKNVMGPPASTSGSRPSRSRCKSGNPGEVQDTDEVHFVGLEGDRKRQDVEVAHGRLRLEREKRGARAAIFVELVRVGQEHALAHDVGNLVPELVDRLEADIRHSNVVAVRVGECYAELAAMRLDDGADLGRQALFVTADKKVIHEAYHYRQRLGADSDSGLPHSSTFGLYFQPPVPGSRKHSNPITLLRLSNAVSISSSSNPPPPERGLLHSLDR